MNTINISAELAQAIVSYLGQQKYTEVYLLIAELQKQASLKTEEKEGEEGTEAK